MKFHSAEDFRKSKPQEWKHRKLSNESWRWPGCTERGRLVNLLTRSKLQFFDQTRGLALFFFFLKGNSIKSKEKLIASRVQLIKPTKKVTNPLKILVLNKKISNGGWQLQRFQILQNALHHLPYRPDFSSVQRFNHFWSIPYDMIEFWKIQCS